MAIDYIFCAVSFKLLTESYVVTICWNRLDETIPKKWSQQIRIQMFLLPRHKSSCFRSQLHKRLCITKTYTIVLCCFLFSIFYWSTVTCCVVCVRLVQCWGEAQHQCVHIRAAAGHYHGRIHRADGQIWAHNVWPPLQEAQGQIVHGWERTAQGGRQVLFYQGQWVFLTGTY